MNRLGTLLLLAGLAFGCGCSSAPQRPSPEQLEAIQTALIDSPRDEVYRAAASVMMDDGLIFQLSDYGAGLLAAGRGAHLLAHSHDAYPINYASLLVWVRPDGPSRARMRVDLNDAEDVRRFAGQVRARCLAAAPREAGAP